MSKKKVEVAVHEPVSVVDPMAGTSDVTPSEPVVKKVTKQTTFTVLNRGGDPVRDYTVEIHGDEAEDKAKEFAANIGGSVK